jgi:hypothetical protein
MPRPPGITRRLQMDYGAALLPGLPPIREFNKRGLVERFGGEIHGHTLLIKLKPCNRRTEGVGAVLCQLRYWNLMRRETREKALQEMAARGGLPKGWTADWVAKKMAASRSGEDLAAVVLASLGEMAALI